MSAEKILLPRTDRRKVPKTGQKAVCEHHWEIEGAQGPVSLGVCRYCGEKREFHNYLSDCLLDKDKYEDWLAKQGRERGNRKGSLEVF